MSREDQRAVKSRGVQCVVCHAPAKVGAIVLCSTCQVGFDRNARIDGTTAGLVEWAARRARAAYRDGLVAMLAGTLPE